MNLEDLKDQLSDRLDSVWGEIQENSTFNNIREQYESLAPGAQKGILVGLLAGLLFVLFMIPYSFISSSSEYVAEFEEKKTLIRELFRVSRISKQGSPLPTSKPISQLTGSYRAALGSFQLTPEQIGEIKELSSNTNPYAKPPVNHIGLSINLKALNLKQILDIGYRLQSLDSNVKMMGLEVTANKAQKGNYFDVIYNMTSFSLPAEAEPEEKSSKKKKRKSRKSRNRDN